MSFTNLHTLFYIMPSLYLTMYVYVDVCTPGDPFHHRNLATCNGKHSSAPINCLNLLLKHWPLYCPLTWQAQCWKVGEIYGSSIPYHSHMRHQGAHCTLVNKCWQASHECLYSIFCRIAIEESLKDQLVSFANIWPPHSSKEQSTVTSQSFSLAGSGAVSAIENTLNTTRKFMVWV